MNSKVESRKYKEENGPYEERNRKNISPFQTNGMNLEYKIGK